jgi:hypothetical protein
VCEWSGRWRDTAALSEGKPTFSLSTRNGGVCGPGPLRGGPGGAAFIAGRGAGSFSWEMLLERRTQC